MARLLALAAILVLASGCASSRLPVHPSATLDEVNTAIEGQAARVALLDGRDVEATSVQLAEDRTTVVLGGTGDTLSVPTDSLAHVAVGIPRSRLEFLGRSTAIGAAPGLVMTGAGLAWMIADLQRNDLYFPSLGPLVVTVTGVFVLVGGTAAGLFHGLVIDPTEWIVVYQRAPDP